MTYSRIIEEHMELCFFTVLQFCDCGTTPARSAYRPQELLCSRFDRLQAGQVEVTLSWRIVSSDWARFRAAM